MYYARAHNAIQGVVISCALALLTWWLAGTVIPMPQLLQGRANPVETQLLLAVMLAPVTVYMFSRTALSFEQLSKRRLWAYDLALATMLLAPVCILALSVFLFSETAFSGGLLRNTALFVGLAFLCLGWLGEIAALTLPIGYFLIIGTIGTGADGTPHIWAFPRGPVGLYDLAISLIILAVGVGLFCLRRRSWALQGG